MRRIVSLLAVALMGALAHAQVPEITAPGVFVPPDMTKSSVKNGYQLGEALVKGYQDGGAKRTVLRDYAGMNDSLPRVDPQSGLQLEGRSIETNLTGAQLFQGSQRDEPFFVFTAEITSVDAESLRLVLDVDKLKHGEEIWIASPDSGISHGPYYANEERPHGLWLPRVHGETTLLIVRSVVDETPNLALSHVMHNYVPFQEAVAQFKQLGCLVNVNCESDPAVQEIKTGVGLLTFGVPFVRPDGSIGFFGSLCTGSLLNNPLTSQKEPFFLTANHCIDHPLGVASAEVFWDFESTLCFDFDAPSLEDLPSSLGDCLLMTHRLVDGTLMSLRASGGQYDDPALTGRYFAGWTTRAPQIEEQVFGISHPAGLDKKFSAGAVSDTSATRRIQGRAYEEQIGVRWSRGLTLGGSSGSALYLNDGTNAVVGILSNGPGSPVCGSERSDYYGSFAAFFPYIEPFIYRPTPPLCGQSFAFDFALSNLRAMPVRDTGRIVLTWMPPTTPPTNLVLVRRNDRFPRTPGDGTVINLASNAVTHIDAGLSQGQEVFYAIFASFDGGTTFGQRDSARAVVGDATGPVTYEPLTEQFDPMLNPMDLQFSQLTFVPLVDFRELAVSASPQNYMNYSNYRMLYEPGVTRFPVEKGPASIPLPLRELENMSHRGGATNSGPGYRTAPVFLKLPNPVPFFGVYNRDLIISGQGFITFNQPADTVSLTQFSDSPLLTPSMMSHFAIPRISFLFAELSPQASGSAWYRIMDDRVVVTFEQVPEWPTFPPRYNSVQTEIFYNGQIRMTFLNVDAREAIVGLSDGKGVPVDPAQADFVFPGRLMSDLSTFSAPFPLRLSPIPVLIAQEGDLILFTPTVETPAGSPAPVFDAIDEPFGLTVNPNTGQIRWPTTNTDSGVYQFDLVVASGALATSQKVLVIVEDVALKPVALDVEVTPGIPTTNDNLRIGYEYSHPENIPEGQTQIRWYRNGQYIQALHNQVMVPEFVTKPGDRWHVEVTPITVTGLAGPAARSNVVFIAEGGGVEFENGGEEFDKDVNQDGRVDAIDVQLVINAALTGEKSNPRTDINRDGAVNAIDVQLVINGALE